MWLFVVVRTDFIVEKGRNTTRENIVVDSSRFTTTSEVRVHQELPREETRVVIEIATSSSEIR